MSTSISLTVSADDNDNNAAARKSKNFAELRKSNTIEHCHQLLQPNEPLYNRLSGDELLGRRHTGLDSTGFGQPFLEESGGKLRRWQHQPRPKSLSDSNSSGEANDAVRPQDFYEEVDERMSRNSLEYPNQQARYIDKWLAQGRARYEPSARSKSFDQDSACIKGNVIGIRGFSSDSYIGESRRMRENYGKLKREHAKLQADYDKLRSQLGDHAKSFGRATRREEYELGLLKALVVKQGKKLEHRGHEPQHVCDMCKQGPNASHRIETDEGWHQIKELELRLAFREQQYANNLERIKSENEHLSQELTRKNHELDNLRNELKQVSLEPQNRKLVQLQQDNLRLREAGEWEQSEYQRLKVNYDKLEAHLASLVEDQKLLGNEQNDELSRVLVELCRLQVYQPKLELTLETERKIKLELEAQIERLRSDNLQLNEQLVTLERELQHAKVQRKGFESNEIERARNEVLALQERCRRFKEERADLQESLRASKMKVAESDAKLTARIDSVRDSCRTELEQASESVKRLECERQRLFAQLEEATERLARCETDRDNANRELIKLHHELAVASSDRQQRQRPLVETVTDQLQQCENKCLTLESRLKLVEARNHELQVELKLVQGKESHLKQQLAEQKRRFALQQKAFDEFKERKEKELAKLRVDVNYEQYNRQISLHGIEKELRSSLKELESMKCRFSKRLGAKQHESLCDTTLASSGRSVQFDDETQQAQTTTTTTMNDNIKAQQSAREEEKQPAERDCCNDRERQVDLGE